MTSLCSLQLHWRRLFCWVGQKDWPMTPAIQSGQKMTMACLHIFSVFMVREKQNTITEYSFQETGFTCVYSTKGNYQKKKKSLWQNYILPVKHSTDILFMYIYISIITTFKIVSILSFCAWQSNCEAKYLEHQEI